MDPAAGRPARELATRAVDAGIHAVQPLRTHGLAPIAVLLRDRLLAGQSAPATRGSVLGSLLHRRADWIRLGEVPARPYRPVLALASSSWRAAGLESTGRHTVCT